MEAVILLLIVISSLHFLPSQYWLFRVFDFAKIQITIIQTLLLLFLAITFSEVSEISLSLALILAIIWVYNIYILIPYTRLFPFESKPLKTSKTPIRFLSVNVYQYNKKKHLLIDLIKNLKPDILLTMESDENWEKSLDQVDYLFEISKKVPKDNTYGIHFYTNLKVRNIKVNHFVAEDIPSIEAELETSEGKQFVFYGIHPPPPSPTEEDTSKERDADILALSRRINEQNVPCIVLGDFNNVAWSKSSKLFKKNMQLLDPRIGRGFISTFHAKFMFFRFPIDLIFHSKSIFIQKLKTEKHINSDHLPLYGEFVVKPNVEKQESISDETDSEEAREINEMIEEGKATNSDSR